MNLLVSGGSGFIGRNLVESLSKKGYFVLAPDKKQLDFTNALAVEQYFEMNSIDTIIHCAMVSHTPTHHNSDKFAGDVVEKNLRMFFNIQRCMRPSMKLIHLGSGAEYSRNYWKRNMKEEYFDENIPEDSYGYSKYLISKYIAFCDNTICLRLFGVFGKYENYLNRFISNAIVKNLFKLPIIINTNVIYDYLYIDDLVGIVEYFINNIPKCKYYNVTPSNPIDLITIANLINQTSDYTSDVYLLNNESGVEYSGDNSKLLDEIGTYKFSSYKQAIESLRKYYISFMNDIDKKEVERDDYLNYVKAKRDSINK